MSTCAIILAAGQGSRLKTHRPKVLHEVLGRPMLAYVIDACRAAGVNDCVVVIGYEKQQVLDAFALDRELVYVEQREQLGTGHAVGMARERCLGAYENSLILCGDGPLIRPSTLTAVLDLHGRSGAAATLATAEIPDPTGYGRIVRDSKGMLTGIVEDRDCTPAQRAIREVNPSYYCYRTADLFSALERVKPNNVKGEYYLTDTLALLLEEGKTVQALTAVPPEDIFSINTRADLALVNDVMRRRVIAGLLDSGVSVIDPLTTWIDPRAVIEPDTVIFPHVVISAAVRIGRDCRVGPFVHLSEPRDFPAESVVTSGGAAG